MEPLVISHGYGLPGVQLVAPAGCLEPVGTKISYTEKWHEDDFLEEEVEKNHTVPHVGERGESFS